MDERDRLRGRSLLQGQRYVISRRQALDAGWTDKVIAARLRTGKWQRLRPGTYAMFSGEPSREASLWAAVLSVGPHAALSHETAAEVHGLLDRPSSKIHLSVPDECRPGRRHQRPGIIVHRRRGLVVPWRPPWVLPATSVEDTVLDLVAQGLPVARRQARRRHDAGARYLDNLYEPYQVCVELDGLAAHPPESRWRDRRRDNMNLEQGIETLRYGWPDATEHRCRTAHQVAAVLRRHGWTGILRACGPACAGTDALRRNGRQS